MVQPVIIIKKTFHVIGFEIRTTHKDNKQHEELPKFANRILKRNLLLAIPNRTDFNVYYGVLTDFSDDDRFMCDFTSILCAEVNSIDNIPKGMISRTIPECKYALFTARGSMPGIIKDTWDYIYREWLPNSGYKRLNAPELEVYNLQLLKNTIPEMEIYLPIE